MEFARRVKRQNNVWTSLLGGWSRRLTIEAERQVARRAAIGCDVGSMRMTVGTVAMLVAMLGVSERASHRCPSRLFARPPHAKRQVTSNRHRSPSVVA